MAPLVAAAEHLLHDLGWRTRIQRHALPGETTSAERRRLRLHAHAEVERSDVVLHVPAGANQAGTRLHRALSHAVKHDVPVLVLVCASFRAKQGLPLPSVERIGELLEATDGEQVLDLGDLTAAVVGDVNDLRAQRA